MMTVVVAKQFLSACRMPGILLKASRGHTLLTSADPKNVHVMRPELGTAWYAGVSQVPFLCSSVC